MNTPSKIELRKMLERAELHCAMSLNTTRETMQLLAAQQQAGELNETAVTLAAAAASMAYRSARKAHSRAVLCGMPQIQGLMEVVDTLAGPELTAPAVVQNVQ
jgi:hypothetical protein